MGKDGADKMGGGKFDFLGKDDEASKKDGQSAMGVSDGKGSP